MTQTSLSLVSSPTQNPLQQKSLLKSFIANFTSDTFFADIVSVALYPADFGTSNSILKSESIIEYIRSFLKDISQTVQKHNFATQQQVKKQAGMVSSILAIRESAAPMTYETVYQYITPPDLAGKKIISTAIQNKIANVENFKENLNNIIKIINAYHELKSISSNLLLYDYLVDSVDQSQHSIFESMKSYRDLVISSYNDLSKLQILSKIDKSSDYHVLRDKESTHSLSKILSTYISDSYNFYKTGYELIDTCVHGLESSSVHIVTAPSNHGKSIFLINLLRNIILHNIEDFEEDSCVIFVTLEDNIPKLTRRISSIFGNCVQNTVGDLYREGSQRLRQLKKSNSDLRPLQENITKIFDGVLIKAIDNVTKFKTSIVLKYSSDNSFSPGDLSKFVDQLRVTEKLNVKLIVMDYIDCAKPTMSGLKHGDEYYNQGVIVHELRQLAVSLDIPILTATQNSRSSENLTGEMSNQLIGDSYLKVRYSDFIYMCRKCDFKTFLDNEVSYDVLKDSNGAPPSPQDLIAYESLSKVLIPYEMKITKAKDGTKDKKKYMLFCTENLRIYDSVDQYVNDRKELIDNTRELENKIMEMNGFSNLPSFEELDFLNNLSEGY